MKTSLADLLLHTYKTVLADVPWPSSKAPPNKSKWTGNQRAAPYRTMKAYDILALPVHQLAAHDAILVLWATWMHLPLAMKVIEAWGFTYATGMPWLKVTKHQSGTSSSTNPIYGPGVWFQHCTELVIIARRGRPFGTLGNPRPARKGIIIAPRQEHSRKPDELQQWIDDKFPGPKLELFARRQRPGWTCWGNQLKTH